MNDLFELLSMNAVPLSHTPTQAPRTTRPDVTHLEVTVDGQGPGEYRRTVTVTGIGLPPAEVVRFFNGLLAMGRAR